MIEVCQVCSNEWWQLNLVAFYPTNKVLVSTLFLVLEILFLFFDHKVGVQKQTRKWLLICSVVLLDIQMQVIVLEKISNRVR